jgi:hypothetical protein
VSDNPVCGMCGVELTRENATRRPELFLCDRCLPRAGIPSPGEPERLPFDQEALLRARHFTEQLWDIPELEGVAVILSFNPPQEHVPYGLVAGRNGPLRTPTEIQHMAVQVHGCLRQQLENAYNVLLGVDAEMQRMAQEIRDKQQQLTELDAAIATAADRYQYISARAGGQADPGSGAPPGDS